MDLLADPATLLTLVGALVLAGAAIGFLAGLFGVGGGAISVPVFFEIFRVLGYPAEIAMPVAVAVKRQSAIPSMSVRVIAGCVKALSSFSPLNEG